MISMPKASNIIRHKAVSNAGTTKYNGGRKSKTGIVSESMLFQFEKKV